MHRLHLRRAIRSMCSYAFKRVSPRSDPRRHARHRAHDVHEDQARLRLALRLEDTNHGRYSWLLKLPLADDPSTPTGETTAEQGRRDCQHALAAALQEGLDRSHVGEQVIGNLRRRHTPLSLQTLRSSPPLSII
eukprot:6520826-Pyramimonas_sp.AAC.1